MSGARARGSGPATGKMLVFGGMEKNSATATATNAIYQLNLVYNGHNVSAYWPEGETPLTPSGVGPTSRYSSGVVEDQGGCGASPLHPSHHSAK